MLARMVALCFLQTNATPTSPAFTTTGTSNVCFEVCLQVGANVTLLGSSNPDKRDGKLIGTHSGTKNAAIHGASYFISINDGNGKAIRPHTHFTMVSPNQGTQLTISTVLLRAPPSA